MACSSLCKQACMQEHMKTLTQTLTVTKAAFPPQELLPGTRDHTFSYVWGNYLTPHQKGPCFGWFWSAEHFWLEYQSLPPTPGCKSSRLFLLCQRIFFLNFFLLLNFHGPFKHFLFPWKQKFLWLRLPGTFGWTRGLRDIQLIGSPIRTAAYNSVAWNLETSCRCRKLLLWH